MGSRQLPVRTLAACAVMAAATAASAADLCAPLSAEQIDKNRAITARAAAYATYAILSSNTYRRDKPLPLPEGWSAVEPRFREFEKGLALTVYERRDANGLEEVAVAFRGTDGTTDWLKQNLFPFVRKQVPAARREFERIVEGYHGAARKITATGHSLGGGLALHMAFTHEDVEAIVFNASPVTKAGLHPNVESARTSVWEKGEALTIPRRLVSGVRFRWHGTHYVETDFEGGSPIAQHAADTMAINLIRLAALRSQPYVAYLSRACRRPA